MKYSTEYYRDFVKKEVRSHIAYDIKVGREESESAYLDVAQKILKNEYRKKNSNRSALFHWHAAALGEVAVMWKQMQEDVSSTISKAIKTFKKRKLTKQINAATAEALIGQKMKEVGLPYIFEAQSIRAKIHVRMCKNYKLIFYIPYKSLMEDLEKSIQQAKTIYDNVHALGANTTFNRVGYYDKFIENQI